MSHLSGVDSPRPLIKQIGEFTVRFTRSTLTPETLISIAKRGIPIGLVSFVNGYWTAVPIPGTPAKFETACKAVQYLISN